MRGEDIFEYGTVKISRKKWEVVIQTPTDSQTAEDIGRRALREKILTTFRKVMLEDMNPYPYKAESARQAYRNWLAFELKRIEAEKGR